MARTNTKTVILQEYKATLRALEKGEIETVLSQQKMIVRELDLEVLARLGGKHKLKYIRDAYRAMFRSERVLATISYWLQDQVSSDIIRAYQSECEQLFATNERIKENLDRGAGDGRHIETKNEFKVIEAAGLLTTSPITAYTLTNSLISHKPNDLAHAAEAGFAVGAVLALHRQIGIAFQKLGDILVELPEHSRPLRTGVRNSMVSAALAISVSAKQQTSIEPNYPARGFNKPQIEAEAKL